MWTELAVGRGTPGSVLAPMVKNFAARGEEQKLVGRLGMEGKLGACRLLEESVEEVGRCLHGAQPSFRKPRSFYRLTLDHSLMDIFKIVRRSMGERSYGASPSLVVGPGFSRTALISVLIFFHWRVPEASRPSRSVFSAVRSSNSAISNSSPTAQ